MTTEQPEEFEKVDWQPEPVVEPPKRMIIYARVSTDKEKQPHSIEAQLRACRKRLEALEDVRKFEVVAEIIDNCSGTKLTSRPGIQQVIGMLSEGAADGVVVFSLDRLSRSVEHTAYLFNKVFVKGRVIISATESWIDNTNAIGRMIINFMSNVNEFTAAQIGEKTSVVIQSLRKQNLAYTSKVFGYRKKRVGDKKVMVEDPAQMQCIKRMEELRRMGNGYARIAKILTQEGYETAIKGGHWESTTVKRILARRAKERNERIQEASKPVKPEVIDAPQPESEGDTNGI
ncbi:PinR Site-specific recombinases, DNA invertase Pin homologs [uncultured Caudovirales phage]|uniref:PinR Site-specific recombinases, DNA invertase Pin homologs n=1 Tax=uncultured Caudovirales phage TaxID=2100421 RepID=A0A6J5NUJ6_9CAUD|nr:PinR Site-specific recombinases, DNA invertase Pin homologs [uncultured Caudovirales phage]